MVITGLTLSGYLRLSLPSIKYIKLTPTEIYQLIIGTNGCGKSSFLRELSPMPAHSSQYTKDGYKIFECTHNGANYVLTSTFSSGSKHTFEKDGELLNDAGNATIQRELIRQHFNLDSDIMSVLLGVEKFTDMSALDRRSWLMRLSGSNFDYAMSVFQTLKTKMRDTQGAIKHLNKRIADETDKLPSKEEIESFSEQCATIRDELTTLMEWRDTSLPRKQDVEAKLKADLLTLDKLAKSIMRQIVTAPERYVSDMVELSINIGELNAKIEGEQQRLAKLYEEHDKVNEVVVNIRNTNLSDLSDLVATRENLKAERFSMMENLTAFDYSTDPREKMVATSAIRGSLIECVSSTERVDEGEYRTVTDEAIRDQIEELRKSYDLAKRLEIRIDHRIGHIQKAEHIHCPKCLYSWVDGVADGDMEKLEAARVEAAAKQLQTDNLILKLQSILEARHINDGHYRRLNQLVTSNRQLEELWKAVAGSWGNPMEIMRSLSIWDESLRISSRIEDIDKQLSAIAETEKHIRDDETNSINDYEVRLAGFVADIDCCLQTIQLYKTDLSCLTLYKQTMTTLTTQGEALAELSEICQDESNTLIRIMEQDEIQSIIRDRHSALGHAENLLSKARLAEGIIADMGKQRDEVVADGEAYAMLVDEISPVDGLIADQIKGFVGTFAQQMTDIIQEIWTYGFEVLPCGFESGELDYKFPTRIAGEGSPSPDVSKGSESQVDIVDFAFRIVVSLYLGLEDMPFYLDEPAVSMDETHRSNIIVFIKHYMEMRKATQLYMISHYLPQSGAFHPCETLMIDSTNIVNIPGRYNTHAEIHR